MEGYFGGPLPRLEGDGNSLRCPRCGFDYLRQAAIEVWSRGEDEEIEGVRITVDGSTVKATGRNPSPRRDGVSIAFSCEGRSCDEDGNLDESSAGEVVIFQHKRQTYIEWRQGHGMRAPSRPNRAKWTGDSLDFRRGFSGGRYGSGGQARAVGIWAGSCADSVLPKRLCMRTRKCSSGRAHRDRLTRYWHQKNTGQLHLNWVEKRLDDVEETI